MSEPATCAQGHALEYPGAYCGDCGADRVMRPGWAKAVKKHAREAAQRRELARLATQEREGTAVADLEAKLRIEAEAERVSAELLD